MPWKVNPEKCQKSGCNAQMVYDPGYGIVGPTPGKKEKVELTCPKGDKYWYEVTYEE
jgi:hypothetical protein